jgi:hypothetical protein
MEPILNLWESSQPFHGFIYAISLSAFTALLISFFRPSVKITWGSTSLSFHDFRLTEKEDSQVIIATEKFYVQNVGKQPAKAVELIHSNIPSSYTLWPPRDHVSNAMPNGGFSIRVPSIAPSELLIVDTVDISSRNVKLLSVNCPDALTKNVEFAAQRQFGKAFNGFILYLMFAGLIATFYTLIFLVFG